MSKRSGRFRADDSGSVGTQVGLANALAFELVIVAADWLTSRPH